jgi:hypothetical protein
VKPTTQRPVPVDPVYYNEKRQTAPLDPTMIGSPQETPLVDPNDPALEFMSTSTQCPTQNEALENFSGSNDLSTGAWVAISVAIVVVGVVVVVGFFLVYKYKSKGPYHRLETL